MVYQRDKEERKLSFTAHHNALECIAIANSLNEMHVIQFHMLSLSLLTDGKKSIQDAFCVDLKQRRLNWKLCSHNEEFCATSLHWSTDDGLSETQVTT